MDEIGVLDKGFVYLVDHMGSDQRIVQAARVSYGSGTKTKRQDDKLIHYLMKNDHSSPFEKVVFEFHVKCPLFVAAQWRTYRWGSFNQLSGRYSEMTSDIYVPNKERMAYQDSKNRQASGERMDEGDADICIQLMMAHNTSVYSKYQYLLKIGLARELARMILPQNTYTEFYWTVNLWNLFHFIHQRNADDAQWEIAEYARAIEKIIQPIVPTAFDAFKERYG